MKQGEAPAKHVLAAFGVRPAVPRKLAGGRGRTWAAGDVVFRPHGATDEAVWKANVLADLAPNSAFRTARPIPAADGSWFSGGWEAWEWLMGEADE